MKAADIPDDTMLAVLATPSVTELWMRWDLAAQFPTIPEKVVAAKVRQLIKRGLADGCDCGCRGDFEITPTGRVFLERVAQSAG